MGERADEKKEELRQQITAATFRLRCAFAMAETDKMELQELCEAAKGAIEQGKADRNERDHLLVWKDDMTAFCNGVGAGADSLREERDAARAELAALKARTSGHMAMVGAMADALPVDEAFSDETSAMMQELMRRRGPPRVLHSRELRPAAQAAVRAMVMMRLDHQDAGHRKALADAEAALFKALEP